MAEARINRHVALEEVDMLWDEPQIRHFHRMYREGKDMYTIAKTLRRSRKEVALLALDQMSWEKFIRLIGREASGEAAGEGK